MPAILVMLDAGRVVDAFVGWYVVGAGVVIGCHGYRWRVVSAKTPPEESNPGGVDRRGAWSNPIMGFLNQVVADRQPG